MHHSCHTYSESLFSNSPISPLMCCPGRLRIHRKLLILALETALTCSPATFRLINWSRYRRRRLRILAEPLRKISHSSFVRCCFPSSCRPHMPLQGFVYTDS